jgi:hypothetical protein
MLEKGAKILKILFGKIKADAGSENISEDEEQIEENKQEESISSRPSPLKGEFKMEGLHS